jgi:integrase
MDAVTRTATLFVRHDSKDCRCKDKDKENDWQKCKCVKTMLLYDGAKPEGHRQWKQSTRRRVWEEAEYAAILGQVQKDGDTKLETFLELLRWSGMALVDATLFDTKSVVNGTLDYKRQKTGKRAIVVLPSRVVALLNKLPDGQPFRRPDFKLESDKSFWRIQLQNLFERAKVTEVKTDLGMRPAHPHQLRDTCAVWYIRKGALIQDVAKMLGDTVAMVERHYLPYIEELKDAHVATNKRILEAAGAD